MCKYGNTSQLIEHRARQTLTVFVLVLAQSFHFTHIYIPLFYIQNNDERSLLYIDLIPL